MAAPRESAGLEGLYEICEALASCPNDRQLISRILGVIARTFATEVVTLRLLDLAGEELILTGSAGLEGYSKPVKLGESVVGRAVLERKAYLIPDIMNSPYKKSAFARRHGLRSLISVPLVFKGKAIGGMSLYFSEAFRFSPDELRLLRAMASQFAAGLENSRLTRDTVSTLVSLARAVEEKDPYTHGHSERVAAYAARLAEYVGIVGADLGLLKQVAPMHDIGKIGISEAIINKPARLSPEERRAMQRHPEIGERIVGSMRSVQPGLFLIRNHHERMDGAGYPDGLRGEEIPLLARVLSIADSYDAMTTNRPYRDAMSAEAAFGEIEANRGTQFDSELAPVFCELGRRGELALD